MSEPKLLNEQELREAIDKFEYDIRKKYDKIIAIDDVQDTRLGDVNLIVRNK